MVDFGSHLQLTSEIIEGQGTGIHQLVPKTRSLGAVLAWSCFFLICSENSNKFV